MVVRHTIARSVRIALVAVGLLAVAGFYAAAVDAQATAASSPAATTTAPSVDKAKAEIDARMTELSKLFADGKYEEFERGGNTPDEWKTKIAANPKAFDNEVARDKANQADAAKSFNMVADLVKKGKPTLSADGTLATYKFTGDAPFPAFALKKVDGVWYPSEAETLKAIGAVRPIQP